MTAQKETTHVHVYHVDGMKEVYVVASSEQEALDDAIAFAKAGPFGPADCAVIALVPRPAQPQEPARPGIKQACLQLWTKSDPGSQPPDETFGIMQSDAEGHITLASVTNFLAGGLAVHWRGECACQQEDEGHKVA